MSARVQNHIGTRLSLHAAELARKTAMDTNTAIIVVRHRTQQ